MFRMLGRIFSEFNKAGKPISVCGEMAGEPLGALAMFGLGLRKFSMGASSIGRVKRTLSLFTREETEEIAKTVQNLHTQAEVIAFLEAEVERKS
jgi:phosphoenolpyruvate-protein kinase (PTS system EI component)